MYWALGLFCLLLLVEGNNDIKMKCKKRYSIDCQLKGLKWFYNPQVGRCLQRLSCRHGFDYRSDCQHHCHNPKKVEGAKPSKTLEQIIKILEELNKKHTAKTFKTTKPPRTTTPTTTVTTPSATAPPITTPTITTQSVTVTDGIDHLFATETTTKKDGNMYEPVKPWGG